MSLSYGGYATRIDKVCATRPFQTEYSARFCGSTGPNLYHQVPRYVWPEPLRPLSRSKRRNVYQPTHLRSPFAARMVSYEPRKPKEATFPVIANAGSREEESQAARRLSSATVDRCCSTSSEGKPVKPYCPRPGTLMSKHPKTAQYSRDTCFFNPITPGKRHYYVINPRWFSEKDVIIRKNNVFA